MYLPKGELIGLFRRAERPVSRKSVTKEQGWESTAWDDKFDEDKGRGHIQPSRDSSLLDMDDRLAVYLQERLAASTFTMEVAEKLGSNFGETPSIDLARELRGALSHQESGS